MPKGMQTIVMIVSAVFVFGAFRNAGLADLKRAEAVRVDLASSFGLRAVNEPSQWKAIESWVLGREFQIVSRLSDDKESALTFVGGHRVVFEKDGSIQGRSVCNGFSGQHGFKETGGETVGLKLEALEGTRDRCPASAEEAQVLALLRESKEVVIGRNAEGATELIVFSGADAGLRLRSK